VTRKKKHHAVNILKEEERKELAVTGDRGKRRRHLAHHRLERKGKRGKEKEILLEGHLQYIPTGISEGDRKDFRPKGSRDITGSVFCGTERGASLKTQRAEKKPVEGGKRTH